MTSEPSQRLPLVFFTRFLLIALGYGIQGALITGIPFLFYNAPLNCLDENGTSYTCSNTEACNNPYGYTEQTEYPQIYSIASLHDFHCDRQILQATLQTVSQSGKIISYLYLLFFPVPVHRKESMLIGTMFVSGLSLCGLMFNTSLVMFGIALVISNSLFSIFYGLMYSYITESNPQWFSKMGSAYINTAWPLIMIIMVAFCYYFGTWENLLVDFTGIPLIFISCTAFALKKYIETNDTCKKYVVENIEIASKNSDQQPKQTSYEILQQNLHAIRSDSILRKNVAIWSLAWTIGSLCYFGCYISLNTLRGDLYFNNMSSTVLEAAASLIAVYLVAKFDLKKTLVNQFLLIGVCFSTCLFVTKGDSQPTQLDLLIELTPIIIAKIGYETLWTVMLQYNHKLMESKYHQPSFSIACFLSIIVSGFIPFYSLLFVNMGISPFFGYGLTCFIAAYYSSKFVEIIDPNATETVKQPLLDQVELVQIKERKESTSELVTP